MTTISEGQVNFHAMRYARQSDRNYAIMKYDLSIVHSKLFHHDIKHHTCSNKDKNMSMGWKDSSTFIFYWKHSTISAFLLDINKMCPKQHPQNIVTLTTIMFALQPSPQAKAKISWSRTHNLGPSIHARSPIGFLIFISQTDVVPMSW